MKYLPALLLVLSVAPLALPVPYAPSKYCTPKQGDKNFCGDQSGPGNGYTCLHWHSDKEFCKEETSPLPSCCRATEKNNGGITSCACCDSVHGGHFIISVKERGWYQHDRAAEEVEYSIN